MPVVQLFVTCLVDAFFPQVGESVVTLLESRGIEVEFPFDQTCCGQPALNAGYPHEAAAMVKHTLDILDDTAGPIVVPSGSCAEMLVHRAPEVTQGDETYEAKASRVAARTRELTQFLVDDLGVIDVGAVCRARAVYHPSCHGLRGLDLGSRPTDLLDAVSGLERADLREAESCCGFGGVFSIEMPEVSAAMLGTKLDNVVESKAELLVGGDVGCLMHMGGGLRRRGSPIEIVHIAEILAGRE